MVIGDKVFYFFIFTISAIFFSTLVLGVYTLFLRYTNHLKGLKWQRLESKWQPVLFDVLSGLRQPQALWHLVGEEERLYFVDFIQRYAQRLRGEERDTLSEVARPFVNPIAHHVKTGDAERRARAVQTLSLLGLPYYAGDIIAALDDPSPLVAMIAARYLMRREHPEYSEQVLQRLHRFTTWSGSLLASMLARVGPGAAPALRQTFKDKEKPSWVRTIAGDALLQLHDFEAGDYAQQILESETDRELVAASLRLLSKIGRHDHVPAIKKLCNSSDFVVRAHAFRAIGRLAPEEESQRLRAALEDDSSWVAIQAAHGLREGGALDILRDIAMSDHPRADLARQVLTEEMR